MFIYAGIDEAGYGPMFGPLVIAASVFRLDEADSAACHQSPPSLWQLLGSAICRQPKDKRRRIPINDSKKLYQTELGVGHLERGVLAFLALTGRGGATCLEQLLQTIGADDHSRLPDLMWYNPQQFCRAPVPAVLTEGQLAISCAMLRQAAQSQKLALVDLRAAVVYEDRFNQIVAATRSKGRCAWTFVSGHLQRIWETYGQYKPLVVIDRQGGRKCYGDLLQLLFDSAHIRLLDESDNISRYELTDGPRSMVVCFQVESEVDHLPVALASMTAKYTRELLMEQFNAFWTTHQPELVRTAGYVKDGRRFLEQINDTIDRLQISREQLIRSC